MRRIIVLGFFLGLLGFGCSGSNSDAMTGGYDQAGGVGADCSDGQECMGGLVCSGVSGGQNGTCQLNGLPGTKGIGNQCIASWECTYGFVCSAAGVCAQSGDPGTQEANATCAESTDCQMMLTCVDGTCQGFQPPFWVGASCVEPDPDSEPVKVYFDVGRTAQEFYRLPFPADIQLKPGGGIDLTGHPNPGIILEEFGNPVDDYFDVIENDVDGFGAFSAVFFRFNRTPDLHGIKNTETKDYYYLVNIDSESEEYGERVSTSFQAKSSRGSYICHNWIGLAPPGGRPLSPNTTYAAILTTNITDKAGNPVLQDDDFTPMLAESEPSAPGLVDIWNTFAPLRTYLAEESLDPSTIAAATVFTTGRPAATIPRVREAVLQEPEPAVIGLVSDKTNSRYEVYTGKITVPFYQDGTRPFAKPADGGGITYGADGLPILVEEEDVKFALSVPTGEAPEDGWPIVLYAHGTGGSEMSGIDQIASNMSQIGAAVIGLEQVQHGDRRGLSDDDAALELNDPKYLFYNFLNPRAARDNNVQTAADYFQLVKLVENFGGITGESVVFDTEKIYFFGHSQGTQGGFMFAAHEPKVKGLLISGAGGFLIESLLAKKNPVDVSIAIKMALLDVSVDRFHPLLNLVQLAFDSVDPCNHSRYIYRESFQELEYPRRNVFMSYGIGDTFTPEATQIALVKSLNLHQWSLPGHEIEYVNAIDALPHTNSIDFGGGVRVTKVVVQYEPDGDYDGHFVMLNHSDAVTQYINFVSTMIVDGTPTLVAP